VREKVSFLANAQPEAPASVFHSQPEPPGSAPVQSATETTTDTQPRKAGWWSRRFGNGE
jgi:ribonuclease E